MVLEPQFIRTSFFIYLPLLCTQSFLEVLDFALQLRHTSRGTWLALHLRYTRFIILYLKEMQIRWNPVANLNESIVQLKEEILISFVIVTQAKMNAACSMTMDLPYCSIVMWRTCLSRAFLSSSRSCLEDRSCMSSARSCSIYKESRITITFWFKHLADHRSE